MIEFRSLGSLAVLERGDVVSVGGARQRRLLAMLLIHRGTVVSVDRLAEAVFAGEPTEAAGTTLRSYIARIRKTLGSSDPDVSVVTQAPGYLLQAPASTTDVGRFESLLNDSQQLLSRGEASHATVALREALALWKGDAYAEFADEDWARPEAQRLTELRTIAEERLIDAELACGSNAEVIGRLDGLIDEHPLRESFRTQLMIALYRSGRQADALRSFRRYREQLGDEVGLEPSPAMFELERRILDHDPTVALAEPVGEPLLGYRLGARLGTSINGTVHEARLPGVDDEFVVHILRGDRVDTPEFVRLFEANARELAGLQHPAVLPIHDYWREPGAAYVVARRVRMRTLRDRLEEGPLLLGELSRLVDRVGGALTAAAERSIFHGSVSIDNVLIDEIDRFFVSNFGIVHDIPPDDTAGFVSLISECASRLDPPPSSAQEDELALALKSSGPTDVGDVADRVLAALEPDTPLITETSRPNPYKGLLPFDVSDADYFFGRDDLVDEFVRRIESDDPSCRLTLVVGGSGSGKSSAVRAGLLPLVRQGAIGGPPQFATAMLPGSSPFKELVESLRRVAITDVGDVVEGLRTRQVSLADVVDTLLPDCGTLLLIIDQFEEVFTLAAAAEQAAFLDCLADAVEDKRGRVRVVATLRADFYDRPLAFQRFGRLVADATVAVPALSPAALESAIVGPLAAIGADAEPALVAELVAAVADQPAALPSLQFTLFELAERRSNRRLDLDGYRALGGVEGAISSRAETLYLSMDDEGRKAVRTVFERLVVIGPDSEVTSRRSPRSALSVGRSADAVDQVIDRWTHARLLTTDNDPHTRVPTVQLAHEAILRSWPRLERWIDDDRESITTIGHLRDAAQSWHDLDRDDGALYRGARLHQALEVAGGSSSELSPLEQDFLTTSRARSDEERRVAAELVERQARTNVRLRRQLALIAAALVVALIVGVIAVGQRRSADAERSSADAERSKAEQQRNEADAQRSLATSRELAAAAEANVVDDPERSMLLALEAIDASGDANADAPPEAVNALHRAIGASRIMLDVPGVGGRLAVSPLGDVFVTEGPEDTGIVDLRSLKTGESVRSWRGDEVDVNDVAFNHDGSMLAVAGDDGTVGVWDPATGEELLSVAGNGPAWNPSFSHDGTRLSIVWTDSGLIQIVDTKTGASVATVPNVADRPAELSPDGTQLARGSWEPPYASVTDIATGDTIVELDVPDAAAVYTVAWSPDGRQIATGDNDGIVGVFDAATGERSSVGLGHDSAIVGLDWSPEGTMLASGSNDGTARVWDAAADVLTEIRRFGGRDLANGVPGVAFSPGAGRLVVSDWLITAVKIFDMDPAAGAELGGFEVRSDAGTVAFAGDEDTLYTGSDRTAIAERDSRGRSVRLIGEGSTSPGFTVSPDGGFAAVADVEGFPVRIFDLDANEIIATYDPPTGGLDNLAWSVDGASLAVVSGTDDTSTVTVVDRSGAEQASIDFAGFFVYSVAFDATGGRLAIAKSGRSRFDSELDRLEIWDWRSNEVVQTLDVVARTVASSPGTNTWITTTFNGSTVDVWDAGTGEHLAELAGHTGIVYLVAVNADGSRIATGSDDGTVRIWDPRSGVQLQKLSLESEIADVTLNRDGTRVATIDTNGLVSIWTLDVPELREVAESRVTRSLDDLECRQYLHQPRCGDQPQTSGKD